MFDLDFQDDRGYIEVYKKGTLVGYVEYIDYNEMSYTIAKDLDDARRYIQEDLLYHDIIFLQAYCRDDYIDFSVIMPY